MNPYILYSVTALGFLLSLFTMLFIFKGKRIAGTGTERDSFAWGPVKIEANSVITLFIVSLLTAMLPLGLEFYLIVKDCIIDHSFKPGTVSERKCESLKGEYKLSQYYEFINTGGIKATARSGSWITNTCKSLDDGSVVLKGIDTTTYRLVVIVRNEFEDVGVTTTNYWSNVLIDRRGKLVSRTVYYENEKPDPKFTPLSLEGRGFTDEEKSFIKKRLEEYDDLHDQRHDFLKTKPCLPALSETNGSILLAFVCHDYTRAMQKIR
jgi:hypothetical protein